MAQQITVITPKEYARLSIAEVKYKVLLEQIKACSSLYDDGTVRIDSFELAKALSVLEPTLIKEIKESVTE